MRKLIPLVALVLILVGLFVSVVSDSGDSPTDSNIPDNR